MFTDSKCLFHTKSKLTTVSEKRLPIGIAAIRENHTLVYLSNVAHVSSKHNLANIFTKGKADDSRLSSVMLSGHLSHPVSQWILSEYLRPLRKRTNRKLLELDRFYT